MRTRLLALMAGLLIATSIPTDAFACWICKKSPNYYGFCRGGYSRGHGDCTEYVADPWTGRTDCLINDWATCGSGLADGCPGGCCDCEPVEPASNRPCSWTDREARLLV